MRSLRDINAHAIAKSHQFRAARKGNIGRFTGEEWLRLCSYYEFCCLCCGRKEPGIRLSPDHVIPISRGGSNYIQNIQPLCAACNHRKSAKTIDYRQSFPEDLAVIPIVLPAKRPVRLTRQEFNRLFWIWLVGLWPLWLILYLLVTGYYR